MFKGVTHQWYRINWGVPNTNLSVNQFSNDKHFQIKHNPSHQILFQMYLDSPIVPNQIRNLWSNEIKQTAIRTKQQNHHNSQTHVFIIHSEAAFSGNASRKLQNTTRNRQLHTGRVQCFTHITWDLWNQKSNYFTAKSSFHWHAKSCSNLSNHFWTTTWAAASLAIGTLKKTICKFN